MRLRARRPWVGVRIACQRRCSPSGGGVLRRSFDRYKKLANGGLGALGLRWKSTSAHRRHPGGAAPRHHPVAVDPPRPVLALGASPVGLPCSGEPAAVGGLISVEHALDFFGVGRLGQRQRQQDTGLLRVERI